MPNWDDILGLSRRHGGFVGEHMRGPIDSSGPLVAVFVFWKPLFIYLVYKILEAHSRAPAEVT